MEMHQFMPFFRASIVISSEEPNNILSNFKKEGLVAPKFHASFLVYFLKRMNARARRSSANSSLDRAISSIKHTLEQRLSVEMDSFESPRKKSNSAEERLFRRYFPTHIFFYRYLVGIHSLFYRCQSVSVELRRICPASLTMVRAHRLANDLGCIHALFQVMVSCKTCLCTLVHEFVSVSL